MLSLTLTEVQSVVYLESEKGVPPVPSKPQKSQFTHACLLDVTTEYEFINVLVNNFSEFLRGTGAKSPKYAPETILDDI